MSLRSSFKYVIPAILLLTALAIVACGGPAATQAPAQAPAASGTESSAGSAAPAPAAAPAASGSSAPAAAPTQVRPTATPVPDATPTPAPTATPLPEGVTSARDDITIVLPEEPIQLNSRLSIGASLNATVTRANLQDPLTWQSGDDLRIVPTSATTGWEQVDADTWRFNLREGVKFHNGEAWNAAAAVASLQDVGSPISEGGSINYTGPYTSAAVDDYTVDINCENACPIFPNTSFFVNFEAPDWFASTSEEDRAGTSVGLGPYQMVEWSRGVHIKQEAYDDYVPVGDHFEFQQPFISEITWLWRSEPTVISAMVQGGEADLGWDVGVESVDNLPPEMLRSGTSAESYSFTTNTIWHPELKKKAVREAIVHAIDCDAIVESLYGGFTSCRGSIIWPGIIGASEANTAPYPYDPAKARQLLAEANYDAENQITITSRGARVAKQVEVSEAVHGYLTEVGINVDFQVVESSIRSAMTKCGAGKALQEIMEANGRDLATQAPTREELQAAVDSNGASCPTGDLIGNQPSNETLDFGRQLRYYMSCTSIRSLVCDPSEGGIQDQITPALEASGQERQDRLEALANKFREDVLFIPLFDLPVFYAVDPDLNWEPRLDPNVRVSTMWFSE